MSYYSNLIELTDYPFPVYISNGTEQRARGIAARCQQGYHFLSILLKFQPELCLLVLAPEHWQKYTGSPLYGVPQTIDPRTVVIAGQNSDLWKMVIPPLESLSPSAAQAMRSVYGQSDGSLDIRSYMDLLSVHEVSHLFVDQAANQFDFHLPHRWLVELFCNLSLHAYVATEEPNQIPTLEIFPQTIAGMGHVHLQYQSLNDFEIVYADMEPPNFVWYLSRLHTAAKRIYDVCGIEALPSLYNLIVQSTDNLPDEALAVRLRVEVHPEVERVLTSWPG